MLEDRQLKALLAFFNAPDGQPPPGDIGNTVVTNNEKPSFVFSTDSIEFSLFSEPSAFTTYNAYLNAFINHKIQNDEKKLRVTLVQNDLPPDILLSKYTKSGELWKLSDGLIAAKLDNMCMYYLPQKNLLHFYCRRFGKNQTVMLKSRSKSSDEWSLEQALNGALKIAINFHRAKEAVMVHASGVSIDEERSVIFAGDSESGKSTIIKMFEPVSTISDELSLLAVFANKSPVLIPTPIKHDAPSSLRDLSPKKLEAIFLISKSERNKVTELKKAEVAQQFISSLVMSFIPDPALRRNNYDTIMRIIEKTPCFGLEFSRDCSIPKFIGNFISQLT